MAALIALTMIPALISCALLGATLSLGRKTS